MTFDPYDSLDSDKEADVQENAAEAPRQLPIIPSDASGNETDRPETSIPEEYQNQTISDTDSNDLADWKEAMRRDFNAWVETVHEIPDPGDEEPEEPDLYSFYEQLAIANTESRKSNRRTAEAFSQWGETLARFDANIQAFRERLSQAPAPEAENAPLPRKYCLALVEMLDRMERLAKAFKSHPQNKWWRNDTGWRRVWDTQYNAFAILSSHLEDMLSKEGVSRIESLGHVFDPTVMAAAEAATNAGQADNIVIEEFAPGYRRHGELLRPAQVKVNINRSNAIKP